MLKDVFFGKNMMKTETLLILSVFVPLIGAFILPLSARISVKIRGLLAFGFVLVSFLACLAMLPVTLAGKTITISFQLPLGFNFILQADNLALFMGLVSSFLSAIIILYSFGYISHYEHQSEYYLMVVLFLASMMGIVFSANLIFLYIFWEITALVSWRLIGFFREKTDVFRADKSFLVTAFGALAMLLGFIMLFQQVGSFDLAVIKESLKVNPISVIAIILILAGMFSKSATLPFHTWLPDAGVAPSPVTALLHAAVLVKIGVYVFARLFVATIILPEFWYITVAVIAGVSAIVSAGAALVETNLKRLIAYSTISQIGFIFLGFTMGNEIGIAGALLYILMHGLAKAGLFLCAGIIEQNAKTKDITKMGGLIKTMPVTAAAFIACAFSVMGIPPFGGFFSKFMVIISALQAGHLWLALLFLCGAFLTIIYLFRAFNMVFLGEAKGQTPKEGSPVMVACVLTLAILSLAGGIFIQNLSSVAKTTAAQMMVLK
jgi:proton-translocating NADH-quinone oxidoreductase chain N